MSWLKEAQSLLDAKPKGEAREETRGSKVLLEEVRVQKAERKKMLQRLRRGNTLLRLLNCEDLLRDIQREIWRGGKIGKKGGKITEKQRLSSFNDIQIPEFSIKCFCQTKRYPFDNRKGPHLGSLACTLTIENVPI